VKILIAPDKFKDALSAAEAADALADGVRQILPSADLTRCPLGDGGEGTGHVLAQATGAAEQSAEVGDPLGRPVQARWWRTPAGVGIIEMAEASGLARLTPAERDARQTSTYGTGQLLQAVRNAGCQRIWLCVGGSATVDGGAGCLQALGWTLADQRGEALPAPLPGGRVHAVAQLTPPADAFPLPIDVLCDVDNPLLGPRGAARVFGPQKTPDVDAVPVLEDNLQHWAQVLRETTGRNVTILPHGGAAGGLPAGLFAACEATLLPGFDEVARHVRLDQQLAAHDLCLTGEGKLDAQTAGGKVVAAIAARAVGTDCRIVAFAGAVELGPHASLEEFARELSLAHIVVITAPDTPLEEALPRTRDNLTRAARDLAQAYA
jgi:glycerate kinase